MREKQLHQQASLLRDAVFAASDGLVTTFAVVAGSTGASLDPTIVVVLGFANLFADGFSMSSGTYLGVKSEIEYERAAGDKHINEASPFRQGLMTFLAFDLAGVLPLLPYLFNFESPFKASTLMVMGSLFVIGVLRGGFTKRNWLRSGFEILFVGGFAAFVAFITGYFMENVVLAGR